MSQLNLFPKTEYNFLHTSKGKNDECYSKRYAVEPLLEFLEPFRGKTIWCPFDTEKSEFVKVFKEKGFNVVFSHIKNGQDFYDYEPEKWDLLISNPPFTNKRFIFERALSFNKPFALIMNVAWLVDSAPAQLFKNRDLQLLIFENRMDFDRPDSKNADKINFSAGYFCCDFLPKQILMRTLKKPGRKRIC
ncbi:MAG: hypothetical protein PHV37_09135 [Candidatus Gastranaerophilales bacterium]|nr:hypothetical protein [Candidatus Gastranaerophilales bacterium]